jgi:hypothetical protein
MKVSRLAGLALIVAASARPAAAESTMFSTEAAAMQACGADQVVWVDLDHARFYAKGQAEYGKSGNGVYGCLRQVKEKYRAGHTQ